MKHIRNIFTVIFCIGLTFSGMVTVASAQNIDEDIARVELGDIADFTAKKTTPELFAQPDNLTKPDIVSLRFVWNQPVNAAAFDRNGKIWIVFDKPNRVDVNKLKEDAQDLASEIYTLPHPVGTIVIITPADNVRYAMRKEGLLWIVDLYRNRQPKFTTTDATIFTQYDSFKYSYLFIPNNHTGEVISIIDPEVGDIISIATTSQLGWGNNTAYRYPDFDLLKTLQGLAFVMNASDLLLSRGNSGITLKALNRSLNITSDLDVLKKHQQSLKTSTETAHWNAFDLQLPPNLLNRNFDDVVDEFKKQILATPAKQQNTVRLKLVQYYVYNGLGTNALFILNQMRKLEIPEAQTDQFFALSGIANFLAHRYEEAVRDFSEQHLPDTTEGVFWRTIAKSAIETNEENNAIIFSHIAVIRDYPQNIKDEVAIIAARTAIATDDDLSAQNFIDILNSVHDRIRNLTPQIIYLTAQKLEMQGYIRNAIKEYQKLLHSNSAMFSAYGRLRHTVLSQMVKFIDTKTAIKELEQLRFAWGEKSFKLKLLSKLADFYLKDKDYYNALRVLNEQGALADEEQKDFIANKMVKIFEDIFIGNHADETLSPIKTLALYHDFKWLATRSPNHDIILQKLADRLVAVDLLTRAKELLLTLLTSSELSPDNRARVGSRLAVIALFENRPQEALDMLKSTQAANLSSATVNPRRIIAARALSALGRSDEALDLLQNDFSPNAIRHKFEIYWQAQDWDNAANTIKYLIQEPVKGQPLSKEQVSYILDWATALRQAGKDTVLVRLRNKFMPYFKNTPYHGTFNVLTNHLEKEKIDIKAIHSIIDDVQNFNNFVKFYTESMEQPDLEQNEQPI